MNSIKFLVENARYVILVAVLATLLASLSIFVWSAFKMGVIIYGLLMHIVHFDTSGHMGQVIAALDSFLLAVILYIFSAALYALFIGDIKLPEWLVLKNLDDLKKNLSSVMALILAVTFLEHIEKWEDPLGTLMFAISIGILIFSLVFYMQFKAASSSKSSTKSTDSSPR